MEKISFTKQLQFYNHFFKKSRKNLIKIINTPLDPKFFLIEFGHATNIL